MTSSTKLEVYNGGHRSQVTCTENFVNFF